jgi:predicted NBD/HSP70 family sugar kinase
MFYSGIDLHQDNCYVATVDEAGTVVKHERLPNHPDRILAYFHSLGTGHL